MSSPESNADPTQPAVFNWAPYYQAVANEKVSTTLQAAMAVPDLFVPDRANFAADLGSGEGRDTLELLAKEWHVVAVDNTHAGMVKLIERATELNLACRLQTLEASFATANWGPVDFITAHRSLPYCPPSLFQSMWQRIVSSLRTGGILSTQLFGKRHSAAELPFVNSFTREQVEALLKPFDVITCDEVEAPAKWANTSRPAHIHEFQILARKRDDKPF
jgi:trans-aconitate methyltransferase